MSKKKHSLEQIIGKLREAEVRLARERRSDGGTPFMALRTPRESERSFRSPRLGERRYDSTTLYGLSRAMACSGNGMVIQTDFRTRRIAA